MPAMDTHWGDMAPGGLATWLDDLFSQSASWADGALAPQDVVASDMSRQVREWLEVEGDSALWIAHRRNLEMLDFWAEQFPEARFLLFYRRLESEVAQALAEGAEINGCLAEWSTGNRRLLKFQRRSRGRSVLVDADAARRFPADFISAVRQFGIAIDPAWVSWDTPGEVLALERLVAQGLVAGEADLLNLEAELDAAAVPLDGGAGPAHIPPLAVLEGYRTVRGAVRRLELELERERETVQRAREDYDASIQALRDSELELGERVADAERTLEAGALLRHQLEAEVDLLLLQVEQLQQELEHFQGELNTRERALAASNQERLSLSEELQRARAEMEVVRLQLQSSIAARDEAVGGTRRLEVQLAEAQGDRKAAETAAEETVGRLERLGAELADIQVARKAAENAAEERTRENEALRSEAAKLRGEIEALSARHREALDRIERSDREVVELRQRIAEMRQSVAWKAAAPLRVLSGQRRRHVGDARPASKHAIKLIEHSGLFDRDWYLSRYEDVKQSGMHPIKHYLEFGAAEGRDPSPRFETRFYVATYPDVAESGLNPLLHYIRFGREEGRKAAPEQVPVVETP